MLVYNTYTTNMVYGGLYGWKNDRGKAKRKGTDAGCTRSDARHIGESSLEMGARTVATGRDTHGIPYLPVEQTADEADTRLTFLSTVKKEVSRILSVGVMLAACVCYLMGTISTDSTIVAFGFSAVVFCFDTMIREK